MTKDSLEKQTNKIMHELNNRTARKIGALDLIKDSFDESGSPLSEDQQMYFDLLAQQIYDDKDFARDSMNMLESDEGYSAGFIDLVPLTQKVFKEYEPLISPSKEFRLFTPQQMVARSNATVYTRALGNLLSNADKYTVDGKIHVSVSAQDGVAQTSVSDTGFGIPNDHLDEIFTYKNDVRKIQGVAEGNGIGLYQVKKEVESIGGSIDVESIEGTASVFYLRFEQA